MAPGVIFLVEKLVGMAVSRMAALYIAEVNLLPSKVPTLHLVPCSRYCVLIISIISYIECDTFRLFASALTFVT